MKQHSDSLLLVWRLAELEALHLRSAEIAPPHLFLGLLKAVDLDLSAPKAQTGDPAKMERIERDLEVIRGCCATFELNTTQTRRMLRRNLAYGTLYVDPQEKRLRRSEESREIFGVAESLAEPAGGEVKPLHLLLALLQAGDVEIGTVFAEVGCSIDSFRNHLHGRIASPPGAAAKLSREPRPQRKSIVEKLGRDLSRLACEGKLEPVIGRRDEMRKLAQALMQSRKNSVILIGETGVGKTCIVEGLAQRIATGEMPQDFRQKRIVEISMGALVAGTDHRGDFEGRLQALIREATQDPNLILFIDEIHLIMGAGKASGAAMDAANLLKPVLARGEICVIGATTIAEYRRHIEKDPAIERRFQVVEVAEPGEAEVLEILRGLRERIEKHHRVCIREDALSAAVELAARYLPDPRFPDKAIDLLDQACSQARLQSLSGDFRGQFQEGVAVGRQEIALVISRRCGIPTGSILESEAERLLRMEELLGRRVLGQEHAIAAVSHAVRLSRSGLKNPHKPVGVFLFTGATGSGKTELAKALAELLLGDERKLIRFDMSEYMEEHSVSKLIGSPPGYKGCDEGGQLTEKIRSQPYSVLLFDEIEKAHPKIWDLFLQVFDEAVLTDSQGRRCDFRDCLIVLTSNLEPGAVKKHLRSELLNRITETIVFAPLSPEAVRGIIDKLLARLNERLQAREITLSLDEHMYRKLLEEGYSAANGARAMERALEDLVAKPLATALLQGMFGAGARLEAVLEDDGVRFVQRT